MPKYIVETIGTFITRLEVEAETAEGALDEAVIYSDGVDVSCVREIDQHHLGETVISIRTASSVDLNIDPAKAGKEIDAKSDTSEDLRAAWSDRVQLILNESA